MKRIIITLTLLVMTFNTFAIGLYDKNTKKSVLELLDDKTEVEEEVEEGFDWLVIPEIDTTEPELPNNEFYEEKEKETVDFINSLKNKVNSFLQNLQ